LANLRESSKDRKPRAPKYKRDNVGRPPDAAAARALYSNGERVGHIVQTGDEFAAFDKHQHPIGRYPNAGEAANAVMRRALSKCGR
jgi:hypothetical protein